MGELAVNAPKLRQLGGEERLQEKGGQKSILSCVPLLSSHFRACASRRAFVLFLNDFHPALEQRHSSCAVCELSESGHREIG